MGTASVMSMAGVTENSSQGPNLVVSFRMLLTSSVSTIDRPPVPSANARNCRMMLAAGGHFPKAVRRFLLSSALVLTSLFVHWITDFIGGPPAPPFAPLWRTREYGALALFR